MEEQVQTPDQIMEGFFEDGETHSIEDFPDQVREDVEGLAWLGYLEDAFDFCGHHFVLRTLKGEEELLASIVCKEFVETLGQARAWVWALIAMALVSVDGDENFCPPIGPNKRDYARARFQYVTGRWYWPLASYLNGRYAGLIERQTEAIRSFEDLSQGSLPTFTPFVGSSTDTGDSEVPTPTQPQEDIREFLDTGDFPASSSD